MFNFYHTLFICSSIFLLIPAVALSHRGVLIASRERIKYPYIKKCTLPSCYSPRGLSADTLSLTPSSLFAVQLIKCSSVTGCRGGSVPTLWQTSLISSTVMSRSSLWRMDGKPPCSTENCLPQVYYWRGKLETSMDQQWHRQQTKPALSPHLQGCWWVG